MSWFHAAIAFIRHAVVFGIALGFPTTILIVLLSLFRRTLIFAATVGFAVSYFFAFALWFTSLDIAYHTVGLFWLLISLLFFGIGPVIICFGVLAWYGAWATFGVQVLLLVCSVGLRGWLIWRASHLSKKGEFAT